MKYEIIPNRGAELIPSVQYGNSRARPVQILSLTISFFVWIELNNFWTSRTIYFSFPTPGYIE